MSNTAKIPVIIDTDIGDDIDDTWALAMLLNCPGLDIKLITTGTGNTTYRAKICAKFLQRADRSDIPVAVGLHFATDGSREYQQKWICDYDLKQYPGVVFDDGVEAIIETINSSSELVTLISIGPVPNIAEALRRDIGIAAKANFIGMFGSIHKQHLGRPGAIAEYNVVQDILACQKVFTAPWNSMTITPLDTCGIVQLENELYSRVLESKNSILQDVIDNYHIWNEAVGCCYDVNKASSILYDTVAIHLAYTHRYLKMEKMGIRITDDGFTVVEPGAQLVNVAIDWLDFDGYCEELVDRLCRTK